MRLETALQFLNKISEHEKVAAKILGGHIFILEAHPKVWKFIREWLFYQCFAVEGGITLYESWAGDWLDLRCYDVYEKSESRIILLLGLKVAYNHPDAISLETTCKACELFLKYVKLLGVRFEPATSDKKRAVLSESELERQVKQMSELVDRIKSRIEEMFRIDVEKEAYKKLKPFDELIRKYGGKKMRKRDLELYELIDILERIIDLARRLDNDDDPFNMLTLRIASRRGITKTLLRKAKSKIEKIRTTIAEVRRMLYLRKVAEEAKKRLEWPYGWLAYYLEELGVI